MVKGSEGKVNEDHYPQIVLVAKGLNTYCYPDVNINISDQLSGINSSGLYCVPVTAVDDNIVENNETYRIEVYQDRESFDVLTLTVIDNDCK